MRWRDGRSASQSCAQPHRLSHGAMRLRPQLHRVARGAAPSRPQPALAFTALVVAALGALALLLAVMPAQAQTQGQGPAQGRYGLGHAATAEEIKGWDIDIGRDGQGLPPGGGTVAQGHAIFDAQCASCHGAHGEGGLGDRLAGGQGSLVSAKPVKTVGSYWPYAPTLFDYIRRAMPLTAPQSLSNDEVYAVSAYVLYLNGLVPNDARLDANSLAAIRMPNRDRFTSDPRPDVKGVGGRDVDGKK